MPISQARFNIRPCQTKIFNQWTESWRTAAAIRARAYREKLAAQWAASMGITVEEMERRVRESLAGIARANSANGDG